MPQNRKKHFIYKSNQLHTEIEADRCTSLFSASTISLAEQHIDAHSTATAVLAVDQQFSILHVRHQSCATKQVYSAYGNNNMMKMPASRLGFTGQRYDSFTACYLLGNGYRAYSPSLMRFLSPDSLSPFGNGGRNSYAYCEGDPANNLDPSGHMLRRVLNFFKPKRDTSTLTTPLLNSENKYYPGAVEATATFPALAELSNWYDSPHTQKKHLKKAAKLLVYKERIDNWKADAWNPLTAEEQADNITNQYFYEINKAVKLIEKVYIPTEQAPVVSESPTPPSNFSLPLEQFSLRRKTK